MRIRQRMKRLATAFLLSALAHASVLAWLSADEPPAVDAAPPVAVRLQVVEPEPAPRAPAPAEDGSDVPGPAELLETPVETEPRPPRETPASTPEPLAEPRPSPPPPPEPPPPESPPSPREPQVPLEVPPAEAPDVPPPVPGPPEPTAPSSEPGEPEPPAASGEAGTTSAAAAEDAGEGRGRRKEGRRGRASGSEVLPRPVYAPKPDYPSRSRDLGEEGTVILAILVGADGGVEECRVDRSSGFSLLDGSALATVERKWRFQPGTRDGEPVARWVRVPVEFRIRKR